VATSNVKVLILDSNLICSLCSTNLPNSLVICSFVENTLHSVCLNPIPNKISLLDLSENPNLVDCLITSDASDLTNLNLVSNLSIHLDLGNQPFNALHYIDISCSSESLVKKVIDSIFLIPYVHIIEMDYIIFHIPLNIPQIIFIPCLQWTSGFMQNKGQERFLDEFYNKKNKNNYLAALTLCSTKTCPRLFTKNKVLMKLPQEMFREILKMLCPT
jgi:hypothetical protein